MFGSLKDSKSLCVPQGRYRYFKDNRFSPVQLYNSLQLLADYMLRKNWSKKKMPIKLLLDIGKNLKRLSLYKQITELKIKRKIAPR